jgi:hypothetical protein
MSEWNRKMMADIDDILDAPEPRPVPQTLKKPKKQQSMSPFYLCALAFLACVLGFAVYVERPTAELQPEPKPPWAVKCDELEASVGEIQETLEKNDKVLTRMEGDLEILNHRSQVIGSMNNNNFHVIKYGKDPKGMVFLTGDWHLDKVPPHLKIEDKEKFKKKYVK